MVQMTYADGQLIMKSIVLIRIVVHLHTSSGTLTERLNFSKNGLAMAKFES